MGKKKRRVDFKAVLPGITLDSVRVAQDIVSVSFALVIDGQSQNVPPSKITPEMVRKEAARLASIENIQLREKSVFDSIFACLQLVVHSQALASEFLRIAPQIKTLGQQLEAMKGMDFRISDDTEGS